MKQLKLSWLWLFSALVISGGVFVGCQKEAASPDVMSNAKPIASNDCTGYTITLENKASLDQPYAGTSFAYNEFGNVSTFVWSVTNAKGTQALSHWAFQWQACVNPEDILYVAAIAEDGTEVEYDKAPKVDPSQSCNTLPVVKFDMGNNNGKTKYIVVMQGAYTFSSGQIGYVKSGAKTGCCTFTFDGIDCTSPEYCSLSQGFFFAKPGPTWPVASVLVGGHSYTEAEGRAIWNSSNKGGISHAKSGFHQLATIYLSQLKLGQTFTDPALEAAVATIETYLAGLPKLTPTNVSLQPSNQDVKNAAGFIGDWVKQNHCDD